MGMEANPRKASITSSNIAGYSAAYFIANFIILAVAAVFRTIPPRLISYLRKVSLISINPLTTLVTILVEKYPTTAYNAVSTIEKAAIAAAAILAAVAIIRNTPLRRANLPITPEGGGFIGGAPAALSVAARAAIRAARALAASGPATGFPRAAFSALIALSLALSATLSLVATVEVALTLAFATFCIATVVSFPPFETAFCIPTILLPHRV